MVMEKLILKNLYKGLKKCNSFKYFFNDINCFVHIKLICILFYCIYRDVFLTSGILDLIKGINLNSNV
jgi:hypothetical protein